MKNGTIRKVSHSLPFIPSTNLMDLYYFVLLCLCLHLFFKYNFDSCSVFTTSIVSKFIHSKFILDGLHFVNKKNVACTSFLQL